ncbi:hypothetical protein BS47DRAFT_1367347 [Hydnum rufescens UP504]|uniref:Uncharacterized protein n=1 Tax=Hydnum rufescens UP504 TaxID=1448309 RepID=A0A9P6DM41_9AGAM|nr:hypothetical protein BS47DRAFT_1367347 [Hydnum rufescens UP504]
MYLILPHTCRSGATFNAQPPKPQCLPPETTIDEIAYHTPAKAGTFYCMISNPTNAQIRPGAKHGTTQPPIPRSSISGNIYEDETNTAPHTRFGGYLHCPISDSTNADQVQSKTWDRAAPHTPTLDFPQQRNTKQIRCHTPTSAGYHTIDTARDIPPLKTG